MYIIFIKLDQSISDNVLAGTDMISDYKAARDLFHHLKVNLASQYILKMFEMIGDDLLAHEPLNGCQLRCNGCGDKTINEIADWETVTVYS